MKRLALEMHDDSSKTVLLVAMPFAGVAIPSLQLPLLQGYLWEHGITCDTQHLYLKAAECYGLQNYNYFIYGTNDSYTYQIAFSQYLFPDHWRDKKSKIKNIIMQRLSEHQSYTFKQYLEGTEKFYNWVLNSKMWSNYDVIGFTLNYGQLLPSLALAKYIKEQHPEKEKVLRLLDELKYRDE